MSNVYRDLLDAGFELDHHEGDLYVKLTPESLRIVKDSGWSTWSFFHHQVKQETWIEVPFGYVPWWEARCS